MKNWDSKKLAQNNKYIDPNRIKEVYEYLDKVKSLIVRNRYDIGLPKNAPKTQTEIFSCNFSLTDKH